MTNLLNVKWVTGRRADAARLSARSGVRQEVFLDVVAVGLEQHAGAAELTNLLLRPLDHAVTLAALGVHHFAGGSHLEALFSARLGLQLGHLALLLPQEKRALRGAFAAEMLVRALKVLGYFLLKQPARPSPRQPLISRAMKLALMAEPSRIGNDEPRNWRDRTNHRRRRAASLRSGAK